MSTPDKCPHCGAVETRKRDGWSVYDCGSVEDFQTNLCRERAANAETRRDKEALRDSVSKLTDTLDLMRDEFRRIQARIIEEKGTDLAGVFSTIFQLCDRSVLGIEQQVPVIQQRDLAEKLARRLTNEKDDAEAQLTREREKWEKLRAWACANFHFDEDPLLEMNRLDAEAKEGQR
ncbi:MAG: hypothetical protein E6Q97_14960 [Desulfurellales bacterium]|nr:MAG: hypothetical protein E6Q97_14960 [Desulfurellales bacterium]